MRLLGSCIDRKAIAPLHMGGIAECPRVCLKVRFEPRVNRCGVVVLERGLDRAYINQLVLQAGDKRLELWLLRICIDLKSVTTVQMCRIAECPRVCLKVRFE